MVNFSVLYLITLHKVCCKLVFQICSWRNMINNNNLVPGFNDEKDDSLKISLEKVNEVDNYQFERYVEDIVKSNPDKIYICTDVRFQSEVELIHSLGGFVVQIYRDVAYEGTVTERGISDYDYVLNNNEFFKDNIIKLVKNILSSELS